MQAGFGHHIDSATQQILRVDEKPAQGQGADARRQSDQQIHVAVTARIATAHRSKHAHVGHSSAVGQSQQLLAMGLEKCMHGGGQFSQADNG